MADYIIKYVLFEHADTSKNHHVVHYHVESGANATELSVIVHSFELSNPEDEEELKTLANSRAVIAKQQWVASLTPPDETSVDLSEEVTL